MIVCVFEEVDQIEVGELADGEAEDVAGGVVPDAGLVLVFVPARKVLFAPPGLPDDGDEARPAEQTNNQTTKQPT